MVSSTNPELASKPSDIEPNKSAQSVTNGNLNPHSSKELFDNCITTPKIDPTNGQMSQTPKFRGMIKNYFCLFTTWIRLEQTVEGFWSLNFF